MKGEFVPLRQDLPGLFIVLLETVTQLKYGKGTQLSNPRGEKAHNERV